MNINFKIETKFNIDDFFFYTTNSDFIMEAVVDSIDLRITKDTIIVAYIVANGAFVLEEDAFKTYEELSLKLSKQLS